MDISGVDEAAHGFAGKYRVVGHRSVEGDGKLDLRMVFSDCAEQFCYITTDAAHAAGSLQALAVHP